MKRKTIILCDGIAKDGKVCPLISHCAYYCPTMDKTKTDHFAWAPYDFTNNRCGEYNEIDIDSLIHTSLNKRKN